MLEKTNYRYDELEKVQRHNQRESFETLVVSPDKTSLNYDVLNKKMISYKNTIRRYLTHLPSKKSIHSNWIVLIEWQIFFDESSLNKLSVRETKLYFLQVVQTFQNFYGMSNVIYANVHFDEKKPHLHIGLIPMKEGRLNSTHIIAKYKNSELETELLNKLEKVIKKSKTSIAGKNTSNVHIDLKSTEQYQEYKELYHKLINQSILPSEIEMKKPEISIKSFCFGKKGKKKQTIEDLRKENDYLESLVKELKSENSYLLKVIRDTEKNVEQLEKQLCINFKIYEKYENKMDFKNYM
ncbi:plasmid recombination protein [Enterococcus ratti]|uniref:plasmid recombination protein n=1 Tax=Enterococcus ratti TaxID=150033 RepID=UPI000A052662|nr:plasmid recombination protein [Enterococcus ratti]